MDGTQANMSVGAYFQNRCEDIHKILNKIDSPDRSMAPSITEGTKKFIQKYPVILFFTGCPYLTIHLFKVAQAFSTQLTSIILIISEW